MVLCPGTVNFILWHFQICHQQITSKDYKKISKNAEILIVGVELTLRVVSAAVEWHF